MFRHHFLSHSKHMLVLKHCLLSHSRSPGTWQGRIRGWEVHHQGWQNKNHVLQLNRWPDGNVFLDQLPSTSAASGPHSTLPWATLTHHTERDEWAPSPSSSTGLINPGEERWGKDTTRGSGRKEKKRLMGESGINTKRTSKMGKREEREMMQEWDRKRKKRQVVCGGDYICPCPKRIMRRVELIWPSVANPSVHLVLGRCRAGQPHTAWHTFRSLLLWGLPLTAKKLAGLPKYDNSTERSDAVYRTFLHMEGGQRVKSGTVDHKTPD